MCVYMASCLDESLPIVASMPGGGAKDHPAINVLAHSSVSNQDRVTRAGEEQKNMDDDSGRKDFPSRAWKSKGDNDLPH